MTTLTLTVSRDPDTVLLAAVTLSWSRSDVDETTRRNLADAIKRAT